MELKLLTMMTSYLGLICFNRTFMELKRKIKAKISKAKKF